MACNGERHKGGKVPAVAQTQKRERDENEQDGLLMDVPAEKEGGVGG